MNLWQQFLLLLESDLGKAPLIISDVQAVYTDTVKLGTDLGISALFPTTPPPVAKPADVVALEAKVHAALAKADPAKFGDGTILKLLGGFLSSPLGQILLQILLSKLGLGGVTPPVTPTA
jgi:hypothetical protein